MTQSAFEMDAKLYEYTQAANPISRGSISNIPYGEFLHGLHEEGSTRIHPFDLSKQLVCEVAASSPSLLANFIHILPDEQLSCEVNATSQLYFVMRGHGKTSFDGQTLNWEKGDCFVLSTNNPILHLAKSDSALYWVHDNPLLHYLGVVANKPRFRPTLYKAEKLKRELAKVQADPNSSKQNRISVLLGNTACPQTLTVTPTLWAMFGIILQHSAQLPHRHNSVALDLILECEPGCYSLVGKECKDGKIINPIRQDWKPYSAFITPPGYWHSHHNESNKPAHLLPIQDAGLQTYFRTLNIEFSSGSKNSEC